mmetsp:Transcript_22562/g.28470  ORF Transcript_22562/g.28470 Transcript_22562/m.28470 type:complete len:285 (-) Transcript_22562:8-862(-)
MQKLSSTVVLILLYALDFTSVKASIDGVIQNEGGKEELPEEMVVDSRLVVQSLTSSSSLLSLPSSLSLETQGTIRSNGNTIRALADENENENQNENTCSTLPDTNFDHLSGFAQVEVQLYLLALFIGFDPTKQVEADFGGLRMFLRDTKNKCKELDNGTLFSIDISSEDVDSCSFGGLDVDSLGLPAGLSGSLSNFPFCLEDCDDGSTLESAIVDFLGDKCVTSVKVTMSDSDDTTANGDGNDDVNVVDASNKESSGSRMMSTFAMTIVIASVVAISISSMLII